MMAAVLRRPRSPYWWAKFRDGGKQVLRSTKERSRSAALAIADHWEQAAKKARAGELTEAQSRRVLAAIMERAGTGETIRCPTVSEFLNAWLEHKETSRSAATSARYRGTVEKFLEHLGPRAARPANAIRADEVQSFLTKRARDRSPKTVAVDAKTLAGAFSYGVRNGLFERNPVAAVELPRMESKERRHLTPEQVRAILAKASPDWKTAVLVGFYTGARLGDIAGMEWHAFNLEAGFVEYRQSKTGTVTRCELADPLWRHLQSLPGPREGFVMPSLAGRSPGGCRGLSQEFSKILDAAGVDQGRSEQKSGRSFAALSFHSLRHSFETLLHAAGVSSQTRMEMAGRASEAVQRQYTHVERETMRAALAKLPEVLP